MKKISSVLAIVSVLVLSVFYSQAQETGREARGDNGEKKPNFWYGPKVGIDLATPTIDQNDIKNQLKSNYEIGFFFQMGRKIYLQPEFYYAVEKETREFLHGTAPQEVTVNSLKVPVLLGIKLIDIGLISAHVMAGPMGSFFLSESIYNPNVVRKKSDYKLQLGGGVDILGFVTLDLRYAVNMNDQVKDELTNLTWKSGVNVTVGLKLK